MAKFARKRKPNYFRLAKEYMATKFHLLPMKWLTSFKPLILLFCFIVMYVLYANWSSLLEGLDRTSIRAYALTNKTQFTTNADIRETLAKEPALKGYFAQDIQEVKDKLMQLSWVKDVVVRKSYPDRLSIGLVEHKPVAVWNNIHYLSDQGVVFNLPADRFDRTGLPQMFGPDAESKEVLNAWAKIQAELASRNLSLKSLAMDNRGSWSITLANNIELRLGRGEWTPKIDRFMMIFPDIEIPEGQRLGYVDLRYEHGAAVGFYPIPK